jgi:hypothetical protein
VQPEVEPSKPAEPPRGQGSLFVTEEPHRTPLAEVTRRLADAGIPQEKFLEHMVELGFLDCEPGDITMGEVGLKDVDPKDIELALKNWPEILQRLGGAK